MPGKNKTDLINRPLAARFELLERGGEGTFFQVAKVRDKTNERICAVKSVKSPFDEDSSFTHALEQTTAQVADLSHPNISRLYEVSEEAGAIALIVEYVRGINLKERIRRIAPFTLSVAVDFLIAIGEALQYAHARGEIHGDLRPQNVIISPEGAVKLTDFGMAKVFEASPKAASANLERSVYYQAPELAAGGRPSSSGDIYALGAILFEMLTGTPPYQGDTPGMVADKHRSAPIPSPRSMNPGVPRSVEGIVTKALQKLPADRYASVSEMLGDLKSVRDALRFGKPLSWSPTDIGVPVVPEPAGGADNRVRPEPRPVEVALPESEDGGKFRMATNVSDDRIAPLLKFALSSVVFILITSLIVGAALWMAVFSKPPEVKFPELVGMKIEDARAAANKIGVRFLEHEEFNEKVEPAVIYRTDIPPGRQAPRGRVVNVWVSKGSRLVWVPDLVKVTAQEAEQKLKAGGFTLGQVDRQNDEKALFDSVVSQNPRPGKRVNRDTAVNLVVSDGPKPLPDTTPDNATIQTPAPNVNPDADKPRLPDEANVDTTDQTPRLFNLKVKVNADGRGKRRVRVEYDDVHGTHPVVDEDDDEGEVIMQRVEVFGPKLTIRVFYGDDVTPVLEQTKYLTSRRR